MDYDLTNLVKDYINTLSVFYCKKLIVDNTMTHKIEELDTYIKDLIRKE